MTLFYHVLRTLQILVVFGVSNFQTSPCLHNWVDVPCTGDNHVRKTMVGTCRDHIRFLRCNIQVSCKAAFKNVTVAQTACNYFWLFTLTSCGWLWTLWTPAPWTSENRKKWYKRINLSAGAVDFFAVKLNHPLEIQRNPQLLKMAHSEIVDDYPLIAWWFKP